MGASSLRIGGNGHIVALRNREGAHTRSRWAGRGRGLKQAKQLACFQEHRELTQDGGHGGPPPFNSIRETEDKAPKEGTCLRLK